MGLSPQKRREIAEARNQERRRELGLDKGRGDTGLSGGAQATLAHRAHDAARGDSWKALSIAVEVTRERLRADGELIPMVAKQLEREAL